jgi:hypothetical protein
VVGRSFSVNQFRRVVNDKNRPEGGTHPPINRKQTPEEII